MKKTRHTDDVVQAGFNGAAPGVEGFFVVAAGWTDNIEGVSVTTHPPLPPPSHWPSG